MGKKEKSETCSKTGWCKNHLFELNPLRTNLYFKKSQKLRLCPKLKKNAKIFQKIFPQVNKDAKFYTPSFILEEEEDFYNENDGQMKKNHSERIQDLQQGLTKTIISQPDIFYYFILSIQMIPNHARKRKYCSVCASEYEDYLQHVNGLPHKECINRNKFTGFIGQFQEKYKKIKQITIPQKNPIDQTEQCNISKEKTIKNQIIPKEIINNENQILLLENKVV